MKPNSKYNEEYLNYKNRSRTSYISRPKRNMHFSKKEISKPVNMIYGSKKSNEFEKTPLTLNASSKASNNKDFHSLNVNNIPQNELSANFKKYFSNIIVSKKF